jgi:hypothetical protein
MKKVIRLTESELVNLIKKVIKEQHQSGNFREGQVVKAKRDKDGQIYTIKIVKVTPNYMFGIVNGPGTYQGEQLKNTNLELYSYKPGEISGNMELGTFTVIR